MSYAYNTLLSGKAWPPALPTKTPLLWDREPWHRRGRNILYADVHPSWSADFIPPVPARDIWAKTKCCDGVPND